MIFKTKDMAVIKCLEHDVSTFAKNNLLYCVEFGHIRFSYQHFIQGILDIKEQGYVLMFVNEGQGMIYNHDKLYGLKPYDFFVLDSKSSFYLSSNFWELIYIYIKGCHIHSILEELIKNKGTTIKCNNVFNIQKQLYIIGTNINHVVENELLQSSQIMKLVYTLFTQNNIQPQNRKSSSFILKAINYVQENFKSMIKLEDIALSAGFSQHYFIRKFKEETGTTPYHYLQNVRLNHAKYLLTTTDDSIKKIAYDCGFTSDYNFYQAFKKIIELSPTEYRKLHK